MIRDTSIHSQEGKNKPLFIAHVHNMSNSLKQSMKQPLKSVAKERDLTFVEAIDYSMDLTSTSKGPLFESRIIHIPSEQAPTHFQLHGHVHDKRPSVSLFRSAK